MKHVTRTGWWDDLMHGIYGPRQGGARIIVDAEDGKTGAGKTGLAVAIARLLSNKVFGYDISKDDLTLSGEKYLERWREHPGADQPSVLILDELGGAGAGNARRAMSNQNVELGNAWQLMRKKRIVSIVTLPHWSKADKNMRMQADYRLWCLHEDIGHFVPYKVGADFIDGDVRIHGYDSVGKIRFPNMDANDDWVYQKLAEEKDELLNSKFFDADKLRDKNEEERMSPDEIKRKQKKKIAQKMREQGDATTEIAQKIGMSQSWVSMNTEPRKEEA